MRLNHHWTRHNITTHYTGLSDPFQRIVEYQSNDSQSKHASIRISIRHNGNITATVTPRTHAVLTQLIELFNGEEQVYWVLTAGSATLRATKDQQTEFYRLFDRLIRFDDTLLPIQNDARALLTEQHETEAGNRRPRSPSM